MLKWMIDQGYGDGARSSAASRAWRRGSPTLSSSRRTPTRSTPPSSTSTWTTSRSRFSAPPTIPTTAPLSEVMGDKVDEVFIGSCMTNIGHFRAAGKLLKEHEGQLPTRLWVAPPTKMDEAQLTAEGYYATFGAVGARRRCRDAPSAWVTRRASPRSPPWCPPPRAISPTDSERARTSIWPAQSSPRWPPSSDACPRRKNTSSMKLNATAADTYRYLNFDRIQEYVDAAGKVEMGDDAYAGLGPAMRAQLKKMAEEKMARRRGRGM